MLTARPRFSRRRPARRRPARRRRSRRRAGGRPGTARAVSGTVSRWPGRVAGVAEREGRHQRRAAGPCGAAGRRGDRDQRGADDHAEGVRRDDVTGLRDRHETPSAISGSSPIVTNSVVPMAKPPVASARKASVHAVGSSRRVGSATEARGSVVVVTGVRILAVERVVQGPAASAALQVPAPGSHLAIPAAPTARDRCRGRHTARRSCPPCPTLTVSLSRSRLRHRRPVHSWRRHARPHALAAPHRTARPGGRLRGDLPGDDQPGVPLGHEPGALLRAVPHLRRALDRRPARRDRRVRARHPEAVRRHGRCCSTRPAGPGCTASRAGARSAGSTRCTAPTTSPRTTCATSSSTFVVDAPSAGWTPTGGGRSPRPRCAPASATTPSSAG